MLREALVIHFHHEYTHGRIKWPKGINKKQRDRLNAINITNSSTVTQCSAVIPAAATRTDEIIYNNLYIAPSIQKL